ncbi:histidine triad (HIT) family protein [Alteribacillus persepolensis]|uniref:Histidine triad (HIT) family protein n=1 Tax=Alteribacillus persepolensis TaxID=568899 RepID=A0A1G8DEL1_9BACI|nr:HIT family protein [Alteribacillus persepolensis]SDH56101.1 histidine triad (HIT) family protein [Alteribacillus persepolensis]
MGHENDCIFCKIVNGDIPASIVYEDDYVLAFTDIGQVTKGHTLLIPKKHQENIFELEEDTAAQLFRVAPTIANAIKKAFDPAGLNMVNNNGKAAMQSVFHYHLHFIPRYGKDDGFQPHWEDNSDNYSAEDLMDIAKKINKHLS